MSDRAGGKDATTAVATGGPGPGPATIAAPPRHPPQPRAGGSWPRSGRWQSSRYSLLIVTWPLVTDLRHSLIYGITADADVSRWDLWWFKTALLERHSNPFYTDMLYYPYRQGANALPLYFHTLQPLNGPWPCPSSC